MRRAPRAKDLGATDFITKGIGTAELLARLDRWPSRRRRRDANWRSRAQALAEQKPIDPKYGLVTPQYLQHARRPVAGASAAPPRRAVGHADRGRPFRRTRARTTASRWRRSSSASWRRFSAPRCARRTRVAQLAECTLLHRHARASISTHATPSPCACARRSRAIALGYRGELIRISLTIGIANSRQDRSRDDRRPDRAGQSSGCSRARRRAATVSSARRRGRAARRWMR